MALFGSRKQEMVSPDDALSGRSEPLRVPERHFVLGTPLEGPLPDGFQAAVFGMGCFWGAERRLWQTDGVYSTAAGYAGGYTPNPTYEEVCTSKTGHAEVVRVVFDPAKVSYDDLLQTFWESHDPTQGMRKGNFFNDTATTEIYTSSDEQLSAVKDSRDRYQAALTEAGPGEITTEIAEAGPFYYAEDYHQQYLAKNPSGYCGIGGTGVSCPTGLSA